MNKTLSKIIKWISLLIIVLLAGFLILTYTKSNGFSFFDKWKGSSHASNILGTADGKVGPQHFQTSTMQILITLFGGGALGVAGLLLQKVTKNRLAEVSILGIGSLNIFFIYIYAMIFKDKAFGSGINAFLLPILLIIVSIIGTICVWAITRSKSANKNTFVIVGIAAQLLIEALSVVVVNPTKLNSSKSGKAIWNHIKGYTLGKVRSSVVVNDKNTSNPVEWWLMITAIALIAIVITSIFFLRRKIDSIETSENISSSTGINVNLLKFSIYMLVAILAGISSAILGTIALLGIIAPSIARLLFKNRMWPLTIASFLIGGLMVMLASFLSMNLEINASVGILATAIVIPYFIFLMLREK